MSACTGEPISWLRLERYALGDADAAVTSHLATCAACRGCLDELRGDLVALPTLAVPARRARALRWWQIAVPALAAAALAVALVRPRPHAAGGPTRLAGVKGVGDVVLGLVRDRGGAIRDDVATFAPGDRWKVVVTCATADGAWIDVAVLEAGAVLPDRPLAPAHVACGNAVPVPGAFELTGGKPNRICVRVGAEAASVAPAPSDPDVACVTVTPEAH